MKSLAAFLLISHGLCVNALSPIPVVPTAFPIPIDCDNLELQIAADYTLRKLNAERTTGYQFGLRQIIYGGVQTTSWNHYFIKFDIQKSDCLVGSEKSWKDCDYTNSDHTTHHQCESKVDIHNMSTVVVVKSYNCRITPEKRSPPVLLGGPKMLPHDDPKIQDLINSNVAKINIESNSAYLFAPDTIYSATTQVVSGYLFNVSFSVKETGCLKDSTITPKDCLLQRVNPKKLYCKSTRHVQSWYIQTEHVSCGDEMNHIMPKKQVFTLFPGMGAIRKISVDPRKPEVKNPIATDTPSQTTDVPDIQLRDLPKPKTINCPGQPWKPSGQSTLAIPPNTRVPVNETTI